MIIILGLCSIHIISSEYILAKKSRGEVLLFLHDRTRIPDTISDEEKRGGTFPSTAAQVQPPDGQKDQASSFCWDNICYDIKVEGKPRRLLNGVSGWVQQGTLTALMGATGAGKTTLLDVLSQRASTGTATGKISVNGLRRGPDFQRKTGYALQQDVHLPTATVRESLRFAALLRQPRHVPTRAKLAYVDEVIEILEMQAFADAIVGVPGEGLNVEQRKRLTIGLELAAKPEFLLFLDEPTSGLDSQTAWTICTLLKKLANRGLAILCTIHQTSSLLLQMFDKILLIEKGGQTIYFGDVGLECRTMVSYLQSKGAKPLRSDESAAEWIMEVTEHGASSIDWFQEWQNSTKRNALEQEIARIKFLPEKVRNSTGNHGKEHEEYAASMGTQVWLLLLRTVVEYWRTPEILWAKFLFSCGAAMAISFIHICAVLLPYRHVYANRQIRKLGTCGTYVPLLPSIPSIYINFFASTCRRDGTQ